MKKYSQNLYIIEVFGKIPQKIQRKYHMKKKTNRYGDYFEAELDRKNKNKLLMYCRFHGIRTRFYNKKWSRSTNYREKFLSENRPPYYCRYCGKKLTAKTMVVDHLIPVNKAKTTWSARFLLQLQGIYNVNDVRNLYPSCWNCNSRKSDKMGFWIVRGILGYRIINLAICILLCTLIVFVIKSGISYP